MIYIQPLGSDEHITNTKCIFVPIRGLSCLISSHYAFGLSALIAYKSNMSSPLSHKMQDAFFFFIKYPEK